MSQNETEEERNITLEEQRRHNLRRQQTVVQNPGKTYKDAVNYASVSYNLLGPFNIVCIHCGVLPCFHRKSSQLSAKMGQMCEVQLVANKDNLSEGCCPLGHIALLPIQFPNELVWPVIGHQLLSKQFHKEIRTFKLMFYFSFIQSYR